MIKSTPHAHTSYVDGRSTAEQMVQTAIDMGFASLGFSEHAIQAFDPDYALDAEAERRYIAEVGRLRSIYGDRIALYLGCERDRFSTADRSKYEYVIGSVHYLQLNGRMVAVDGPKGELTALVREGFGGDGIAFARAYFTQLSDYVAAFRPEIIGHFDLLRKHNVTGALFDAADPGYACAAMDALEAMADSGALLEVNTGAIARGYMSDPYPELRWLRRWRELGGRAILSSDCHDAPMLDCGYDVALERVRAAGFKELWALNPKRERGELFVACRVG